MFICVIILIIIIGLALYSDYKFKNGPYRDLDIQEIDKILNEVDYMRWLKSNNRKGR